MRINAAGRTFSELLEDAGRRYFALLTPPEELGEALREKLVVEGSGRDELLGAWIQGLWELAHRQQILMKSCRVVTQESNGRWRALGEILGELYDAHRHSFRPCAPGAQARVVEDPQGLKAEVICGEKA